MNDTIKYVDSLEDFTKLPVDSQRAFFGKYDDNGKLWPKNKKGIRVKPKKTSTKKKQTNTIATKKTKPRKAVSKKSSIYNTNILILSAVGLGILTYAIVKRPQ